MVKPSKKTTKNETTSKIAPKEIKKRSNSVLTFDYSKKLLKILLSASTSPELRKKIIEEIEKGMSLRVTAEKFGLSKSTVQSIACKYQFSGKLDNFKITGRMRLLLPEDEKVIFEEVRKNPNVTINQIRDIIGNYMCKSTIHRRLCEIKEQIKNENNENSDVS